MNKQSYQFTLYLDVFDPRALFEAARVHPDAEGLVDELLDEEGNIKVAECLMMLLDPGSLTGCKIHESAAQFLGDGERDEVKPIQAFEVTGIGFDGGSDETDYRVLWVRAPSREYLEGVLKDVPYKGLSDLNYEQLSGIDFTLPGDDENLRAKLREFAGTLPDQTFTNYFLHCDQHWTDEWDCMCNDRCPVCNKEIEPYKSVDADGKVINHVGDDLAQFEKGEGHE